MALPRGNQRWTNAELRIALEQAHASARDKWGAYLSDLALGYWTAYNKVNLTLKGIDTLKKSKMEQAQLFWSVILPAVAGGFLGGIVGLRMKSVMQESSIKFIEHSLIVDTAKTITSDSAKYQTKQLIKSSRSRRSKSMDTDIADPAQFGEILKNRLLHVMVAVNDQLIHGMKKKSPQLYRDQMFVLCNSPFI